MKLYRSPNNKIFAYEPDGSQDHLIPEDYVAVTQEEADIIIATAITPEENKQTAIWLLHQTDWATYADVSDPTNNPYLANQSEFMAYRAAVRWYAVHPPAGAVEWPAMPEENWIDLT